MDTAWNRCSNLISLYASCMAFGALYHYLVAGVLTRPKLSGVTLSGVRCSDLLVNDFLNTDQSTIHFNLQVDHSGQFNWGTHQVFGLAYATWATDEYPWNEAVVWDHIMTSSQPKHTLKLESDSSNKYPMRSIEANVMKSVDAQFHYRFHYMPYVGIMEIFSREKDTVKFMTPSNYTNTNSKSNQRRMYRDAL